MPSFTRSMISLTFVAGVIACAGDRGAQSGDGVQPDAARVLRGFATYAHEVRAFTPCDSAAALWVVDSAQALWGPWRELAGDAGAPAGLFAVVEGRIGPPPSEGFGEVHAGTLVVDRVLYVAREGYGCAAPWDRFAFRAFGNEPFWSLTVLADTVTLVRWGPADRAWLGAVRTASDTGIMLRADGADGALTVALAPRPCRDTMAGSYFGYTATVRLGADSLAGCALAGGGR
jgi:putative lipoprotein